jgi:ketosteroid isomerase-like protein
MMIRGILGGLVLCVTVPVGLVGQEGPDPLQPRPPLILAASRAERLEIAVRMYLQDFIGAIQRADTMALASLVPEDVIPTLEKPVAQRAGCPSVANASERLSALRMGESVQPVLPLAGIRLRNVTIVLGVRGDTVARVQARIAERRSGRERYAPIDLLFVEQDDAWRIALARGALVGLCGLAAAQ